jgi:DNA-nicking Smr family endonuclease
MRRRLTEDERRLWAGATRSVRPLQPGEARTEGADAPDVGERLAAIPAGKPLGSSRPARAAPPAAPALAPLGRRDKQRLARGHSPIDARIDLHGMTQAEAHGALLRFLQRAQAEGATFALVITGTGARGLDGERGGHGARGVLRRQVPLWLELPEFRRVVVGFEPAHVGHGGEGAFYVRIRRARRSEK